MLRYRAACDKSLCLLVCLSFEYDTVINIFQIAFAGARITADGRTAYLMSGRTVKEFRGQGLNRRLMRQMKADWPHVTTYVFSGEVDDAVQRIRQRGAKTRYLWVSF